ncbi:discoidin domain-containing protein [Variovorax atrisoli]|uniref:discoidin domain-containing protein n=1 Tax=Variovorax atrisoli TaxID=3394203 RepID=UPI0003A40FF5|nr:discoidin domain-containing protein [Variovorax paradoxus]
MKRLRELFLSALTLFVFFSNSAHSAEYQPVTASSSSQLWPLASAYDNNTSTIWSSNTHASPVATEEIAFWWSGTQSINYVKLMPRYVQTCAALGFPVDFKIYYSGGPNNWVEIGNYVDYPRPNRCDWIVIPLPATVQTEGIRIVATRLGGDDAGTPVFQLAEVKAGGDAGFNQLSFGGNNAGALPNKMQVAGVQANAFNPNRLSNWNYDERGSSMIAPNPGAYRNIYSPQAVQLSGSVWRIYFHGWDGVSAPLYDRIYTTVTFDDYLNFDAHYLQIDHGNCQNVGNESVVRVAPGDWRMTYTCMRSDNLNKTGYATSGDGANWSPNAGGSTMINVTGYPNWAAGDYNGVNPIIKDSNAVWHYYFMESSTNPGVEHATSTDGVNFAFVNRAQQEPMRALNDVKAFSYGGSTHYLSCYHMGQSNLWMSTSTSLSDLGPTKVAFSNYSNEDKMMITCGWVQDGTRVYGMLYGACAADCDPAFPSRNRLFARWLQKKVVFQNNYVTWDVNTGFGMKNSRLAMSNKIETGVFKIYDTDGQTLLYTSPVVTVREGDLWNYAGP